MTHDIIPIPSPLSRAGMENLPATIADAGPKAGRRFVEFFTANIRNKNTRAAYAQAVKLFFQWCDPRPRVLSPREPRSDGETCDSRAIQLRAQPSR